MHLAWAQQQVPYLKLWALPDTLFSDMLSLAVQEDCGICSALLQPCSFIVRLSCILLENKFFDT